MIVYLGMPKCASTWLWEKIKHNFDYNGLKEPHTLVEWGTSNGVIDFSTNNWSMDSSTVRSIDKDVTKYILIVRDQIELATSYYLQTALEGESFDDFVNTLIKTKLLCFGDIIERWYRLVDKRKILIYHYNKDIQNKQESFLIDICGKLGINEYDKSMILSKKLFETENKPILKCDDKLIKQLDYQMQKFYSIVGN
jgi:hypothetical protein